MRLHLINAVSWFLLISFAFPSEILAEKKDYKGLFGSYRRERFTENEGKATSFGIDIMLGTMFPLSNLVTSTEGSNAEAALNYASFFNFDIAAYLNVAYHWQFYGRVGSYNYDTRKENTVITNPQLPLFHEFTMTAIPLIAGVRYRFTRNDVVPYVGLGAGLVYTDQYASYDYSTVSNRVYALNLAAEATMGLEFYFSSNAGIRLEVNGFFMQLPERTYAPFSNNSQPAFSIKGNPISVRYASGIFVLL